MAVRPSLNHKPVPRMDPTTSVPLAPAPEEGNPKPRSANGGYRPPSRQGKRAAVAWLEPEALKQLNLYAIQHDRNVQDLLVEAINEWFATRGLSRFDSVGR
jgi:hypothetical protein